MTTLDHVDALRGLSDRDLIAETHRLDDRDRHATAHVIAALMEMDARELHLAEGCPSLYAYCTQVLHFSEHAAYGRIEAARATRRFPTILDRLADGSLTLTTVGLLAAHLTPENHAGLLTEARHKTKREVQVLIATLRPLPAVPSSVRKLPAAKPIDAITVSPADSARAVEAAVADVSSTSAPPGPQFEVREVPSPKPAVVVPLAPERFKVQVTISREAYDKLRRAQDLLRHAIPNGDPAAIFERALMLLVEDLERKRLASAKRPRAAGAMVSRSRHVPAAVKRAVWARDEGRCAFVGHAGRCAERGFLEFHHVVPFADGGATEAENLQLRCRAHNAFEAEAWFGPLVAREWSPVYAAEATRSRPSRPWYKCRSSTRA
jgi:5-methylcytosine-specific restriction endonuclease McrA